MKLRKIKLTNLNFIPITDSELSKVLGGYIATTTGVSSASTGPSASVTITKGVDADSQTSDSDAENDADILEDELKRRLGL